MLHILLYDDGNMNKSSPVIQTYKSDKLIDRLRRFAQGEEFNPFIAGYSCCYGEIMRASSLVVEDLESMGKASAGDSDLLIVNGVILEQMIPYLKEVYEQMLEPKYVMAFGTCVTSGAIFDSIPLEKIIPVDILVPGCPPSLQAITSGIELLHQRAADGLSIGLIK